MKRKIIMCLLFFNSFIFANELNQTYIHELNDYATAVLKAAESEPQKALESLQEFLPTSPDERAQQQFLYTQLYGSLDYPEKMLHHSQIGLQAIDADSEPWLTNLLLLAQADAKDRLEKGVPMIDTIENIIQWSKANKHHSLAAIALIQLSHSYINIEDYNQALIAIQQATEIAPTQSILIKKGDVASHTAGIYVYRNEFELALPYFQNAYEQEKTNNNILGMSIQLFEMGRANLELNNSDLGKSQLQQSIKLSESIDDLQGVAYAKSELAYHHIIEKKYPLAEELLLESSEIFSQAGNTYMFFDNLLQLIHVKTQSAQFNEAQSYINSAEQVNQDSEFRYGEPMINKQKAFLHSAMGDHQKAFNLYVEATGQHADLINEYSSEKLHEIRARYEVDKSAVKNQLLTEQNSAQSRTIANQSKLSFILMVFLVLMTGLLSILVWFNHKLKKQSKKLHELANYDDLTGLRNRNNMVNSIRKKLEKMNENDGFTLVMIDLDHFKIINDTYGHALGDKVLRLFGTICIEIKMHTASIGRMGGEEFLICFENTNQTEIHQLIEKLRIKTQQMPELIKAPGLKVSMSAGICYSHGGQRFRDILKCADEAMYQAKHNGRNQVVTTELN